MRAHLQYLWYVLRHKWLVFVECSRLGVPLLGVLHDWSKFRPSEWFPYVHSFYNPDGSSRNIRDETGYYDPGSISVRFDLAWLHHQHHNKHHWQYYILIQDEDKDKTLPMPSKYRREMLADWRGASRAITGTDNTREWYLEHRNKIQLHSDTRGWIEQQLRKA